MAKEKIKNVAMRGVKVFFTHDFKKPTTFVMPGSCKYDFENVIKVDSIEDTTHTIQLMWKIAQENEADIIEILTLNKNQLVGYIFEYFFVGE